MNLCRIVGVAMLVLLTAPPALADKNEMQLALEKSPEELIKGIENQHPAIYYVLAGKLFESDRKQDATFWFYAGQLRYRFHLAAHPELDPSGDLALFAALSQNVGSSINQWAMGDLGQLGKTLGEVKAWDEKTANGFTSKETFAEHWKTTRDGMDKLTAYIRDNADAIREHRTKNGLQNRN